MANKFLENKLIGISISGSADIEKKGYNEMHLRDSLVELARYLLACGAKLAYGGDITYDIEFNYAQILLDLIENYAQEYHDDRKGAVNFVCYPIYKKISDEVKAKYIKRVEFINVEPKGFDITNDNWQETEKALTVEDIYKWSVSLKEMRETMNDKIDIRIVMGGKVRGYKGRYPGIVEEVYLALQSGKPTYLIGAFGGAAWSVIQALKGNKPDELTSDFQFQNPLYRDLVPYYNARHPKDLVDYPSIVFQFNKIGITGLSTYNGLSEMENEILFTSKNISEIIMYILKGLKRKLT
jgi:hypothetical protein